MVSKIPGSLIAVMAVLPACTATGRVEAPVNGSLAASLGMVVDGTWQLDANQNGRFDGCSVDRCVAFGGVSSIPLAGDWDGDGADSWGAFDRATATFSLNVRGDTVTFAFGTRGDIPVVGDWNGDGVDTVGVFAPLSARFSLRNSNSAGDADQTFAFGLPGDVPFAGDWDGDGRDSIGVYRQAEARFLLQDRAQPTVTSASFVFGAVGDIPVVGDWNGDRIDSVGVYDPRTGDVAVRDDTSANARIIAFGVPNARPVSGHF